MCTSKEVIAPCCLTRQPLKSGRLCWIVKINRAEIGRIKNSSARTRRQKAWWKKNYSQFLDCLILDLFSVLAQGSTVHCFPKNQFTFKLCSVHCCSKQEFCSVVHNVLYDVLVSNKVIAFSLAKCQSHNCKWGICLKTWFQLVSVCAWLCLCTVSTWPFKAPARNNTNSIHQTIVKRFHTSEGTSNGRGGPFCSTSGAVKLILTSWGHVWCAGAISCIGWTRPFGHWKGMENIM